MQSQFQSFLLEYMPDIDEYKAKFDSLNSLLNKTTLTGKISSLEIAENLFNFMDETQQKFSTLQDTLIETLIAENLKKVNYEARSIAQATIDLLIRSLYERTSNVIEFSQSRDVCDFLEGRLDAEAMREKLTLFSSFYSVYDEIVLFDTQGHAKINLDSANKIKSTQDPLVFDALASNSYLDLFRHSDIQPHKQYSLIYAAPVKNSSDETIGAVCMCYKFEDEMRRMLERFNYFGVKGSVMLMLDENKKIISSSNQQEFPNGSKFSYKLNEEYFFIKQRNKDYLASYAKSVGYREYYGPKWESWLLSPLRTAFDIEKKDDIEEFSDDLINDTSLMAKDLKDVVEEAENINEDLGDVVINGEIIASKSHSYSLNPILNNIRSISEDLNNVFIDSINGLLETILSSSLESVKFLGLTAVDMLDRNLYERVNNIRYFSNHGFLADSLDKKALSDEEKKELNEYLDELNSLYSVYHNIMVFDTEGYVIAVSNRKEERLVGEQIDGTTMYKMKNNRSSNFYHISDYAKTKFYDDKETYIIYSSITSNLEQSDEVVGGVAAIVDTRRVLTNILKDSLPAKKGNQVFTSYGLFTDRGGEVVATTDADFIDIGSTLELDEKYFKIEQGSGGFSDIITYRDKKYIMGSEVTTGYREFKLEDGYKEETIAFIFIQI